MTDTAPPITLDLGEPEPINPIPLPALEWFHCRSIVGKDEGGIATFCGAHKAARKAAGEDLGWSPYCLHHTMIYFNLEGRRGSPRIEYFEPSQA